jgi:hypothetical protein
MEPTDTPACSATCCMVMPLRPGPEFSSVPVASRIRATTSRPAEPLEDVFAPAGANLRTAVLQLHGEG